MGIENFLADKASTTERDLVIKPGAVRLLIGIVFILLGLTFTMKGGLVSLVGVSLLLVSLALVASMQQYKITQDGLERTPVFSQFKSLGWPQQPEKIALSELELSSRDVKGSFKLSAYNGVIVWPFNNTELYFMHANKDISLGFLSGKAAQDVIDSVTKLKMAN